MAVYTVLLPPPSNKDGAPSPLERAVFVREGFAWLALFFPVLWLLFHRMWLLLILFVAVTVGVELAASLIGGPVPGVFGFAIAVLFAFEANGLRRWALVQRGYEFAGIVAGSNRSECERRFFAEVQEPVSASVTDPTPTSPRRSVPVVPPRGDPGVLGLFPQKGTSS